MHMHTKYEVSIGVKPCGRGGGMCTDNNDPNTNDDTNANDNDA